MNKNLTKKIHIYITIFFILSCNMSTPKHMYSQQNKESYKKLEIFSDITGFDCIFHENFEILFSFKYYTFYDRININTPIKDIKTKLKDYLLLSNKINKSEYNKDIEFYYIGTEIPENYAIKNINTNNHFKRDIQNGQLILIKFVE